MQGLQEDEKNDGANEFAGDDSLVVGECVVGVCIVIEGKDHLI